MRFTGTIARRDLLPNHETADGQSEPIERGARMGADVAGHWAVCMLAKSTQSKLSPPFCFWVAN